MNIMEEQKQCEACVQRMTARDQKLKNNLIRRLNQIEGQIRGIRGMVEKDQYCDDILNQVAAARSALSSVAKLILENHIRGCVVDRIKNNDDEIVDELLETIRKML